MDVNPLNLGWMGKAILSGIILGPIWLAIPFFVKNFNLKPEIAVSWYFLGVSFGSPFLLKIFGALSKTDLSPNLPNIFLVLIGGTAGALANILLFKSVSEAPNPAFATTINGGVTNILMFAAAVILAICLPAYFNPVEFGAKKFLGILVITLGVFLLGT